MALSSLLLGSTGAGGSASASNSASNAWSHTAGTQATQTAQQAAATANNSAMSAWEAAAHYNSKEAQKQREWQERMANTTYQRSVADMKAAGINPILAASMGLGTASVGSGAMASMTAPNTYMSNTYPEQNSASTAQSHGEGSSWQNSESGLATALTQIAEMFAGAIGSISSGVTVNNIIDKVSKEVDQDYKKTMAQARQSEHSKWKDYKNMVASNNEKAVGNSKILKTINSLQWKATH